MNSLTIILSTLILSSTLLKAQNAILVKDRIPVTSDTILKQDPKRYGPNDNLDGPGIENKYFAFFIPLMKASINGDLIGKRKDIHVLSMFKKDTKRHGGADWGEDIISTKNAFGAGYFGVSVGKEIISPSWKNTESIEINIISDKANDTAISLTFKNWKVADRKINVSWTISTNWEARWVKHNLIFPKDFKHPIKFGITKHLNEYKFDKENRFMYGLGDQTYKKVSPHKLLMAVKADKENFLGFFTEGKNTGVDLKLSESGSAITWTTYSWAGEPKPVFTLENWQSLLFEGSE